CPSFSAGLSAGLDSRFDGAVFAGLALAGPFGNSLTPGDTPVWSQAKRTFERKIRVGSRLAGSLSTPQRSHSSFWLLAVEYHSAAAIAPSVGVANAGWATSSGIAVATLRPSAESFSRITRCGTMPLSITTRQLSYQYRPTMPPSTSFSGLRASPNG